MKNSINNTIIYKDNINYPKLYNKIKKAPKKLYVKGNLELLNKPSIAIVGSRNYSEYGKKMAKKFTKELVNEGYIIVSGMAKGIDYFAHEQCINSRRKDNCGYCKRF